MAPSENKAIYLQRPLEQALATALSDTPVVCLLGPRQCGKSTLALQQAPGRAYYSLDDLNYLSLAQSDPQGFINDLPEYVTIDEVQRVPELTLAIKRSVDNNRKPGRFLLTGSANLLQLPKLADSLAGRMECIQLHTFSESEKEGTPGAFLEQWLSGQLDTTISNPPPPQPSTLPKRIIAGGYPEAFKRSPDRSYRWQRQYIQSIIERDIHDISQVKENSDIARFIEYMSHQTAQLLNISETAKALGHTRATVEKYLVILERLYLLRRLPAWHRNSGKRLVKAPKLHFYDSGLAAALSDTTEAMWLQDRERFGHLLESFILQQISVQASWLQSSIRVWHYRDKDQVEVDCALTQGTKVWGIEVKASSSVKPSDAKGLRRLAAIAGEDFQGGIVFYNGNSILPLGDPSLLAVPISKLWEL